MTIMRRWTGVILVAIVVGAFATWALLHTPVSTRTAATGSPRAARGPGRTEFVSPATSPEHRYTTRGRLEALPGPTSPYLRVHHESIDNFMQRDGSLGMREMIMEFPAFAPGVSLSDLSPGDTIEFDWEVRYASEPTSIITAIRKLPVGTDLRFTSRDEPRPK